MAALSSLESLRKIHPAFARSLESGNHSEQTLEYLHQSFTVAQARGHGASMKKYGDLLKTHFKTNPAHARAMAFSLADHAKAGYNPHWLSLLVTQALRKGIIPSSQIETQTMALRTHLEQINVKDVETAVKAATRAMGSKSIKAAYDLHAYFESSTWKAKTKLPQAKKKPGKTTAK